MTFKNNRLFAENFRRRICARDKSLSGGLPGFLTNFTQAMGSPFQITWTEHSLKTILICSAIYITAVAVYLSSQRQTRDGEEHGSARWESPHRVNAMFEQKESIPLTRHAWFTVTWMLTVWPCLATSGSILRVNCSGGNVGVGVAVGRGVCVGVAVGSGVKVGTAVGRGVAGWVTGSGLVVGTLFSGVSEGLATFVFSTLKTRV